MNTYYIHAKIAREVASFNLTLRIKFKRWHITLSTWFRDYVYIPLGGNRTIKWRWYYNIFITFLVSGLWHGANWTFVIWGALHGTYLIIALALTNPKKQFSSLIQKKSKSFNKLLDVTITFILVAFAWIFFRANNLDDAIYIISNLFVNYNEILNLSELRMQFRGIGLFQEDLIKCFLLILALFLYSSYERSGNVWEKLQQKPKWIRWSIYYILVYGILFIAPHSNVNNFIYFQF